jgi:hypothetical protein
MKFQGSSDSNSFSRFDDFLLFAYADLYSCPMSFNEPSYRPLLHKSPPPGSR